MSFLHPAILTAGLLAIAIPIIIHFLRRRRRPIEWAAMRFLQDALRKRRRRLRLEQLLLLLTRCTLVALLAFAIARPTAPGGNAGRPGTHVLVIDNSIASALEDSAGVTDLERSISSARAFLRTIDPARGDAVGLVTLGAPGRALVWPPSADTDAARRALDRITPTDGGPGPDALRAALGARDPDEQTGPLRVHLFSSWRGVDADELFETAGIAGVETVRLHAVETGPADAGNVGIASISVTTPTVVGSSLLAPQTRVQGSAVRTGRLDAQTIDIELIARPGGAIAGRTTARFEPGETETTWTAGVDDAGLTAGRGGRVAIVARLADDPNPRDNAAGVVIARRRELRVGVVERLPVRGDVTPGTWVLAALTPDDRAGIESFRIDPASLRSIPAGSVDALVILEPSRVPDAGWSRAGELLARGGLVAVAPDANAAAAGWHAQTSTLTDAEIAVNTDAGVREDPAGLAPDRPGGLLESLGGEFADLVGSVRLTRRLVLVPGPGATTMMTDAAGQPFAVQSAGRTGAGTCVVFASAFDVGWTDLPARPIFLPIMQELVRRGSGRGLDTAAIAGRPGSRPNAAFGVDRWVFDEPISGEEPPPGPMGARAGVLVGVGVNGEVVRTLAVRPDALAAGTMPAPDQELIDALTQAFPGAEIGADSVGGDASGEAPRRASAWGDRVALLILAAAAIVAVFEALVARVASHPSGSTA